jgi:hypothetical protein
MMNEHDIKTLPLPKRLLRLALGLTLLSLFAGLVMSGATPPGIAGEVVRHNRELGVDASPLFYTEVENMAELEEGVRRLRSRPRP